MNSMEEKKAVINGLNINYKVLGGGKPLLILHGWTISGSESWNQVQEILSQKGYKVICPDLPGFGKSQAPPYAWSLDDYCDFIGKLIREPKRNFVVGFKK